MIIGGILIIVVILIIAGIVFVKAICPNANFCPAKHIPTEWRYCEKNADCVETSETCCNCNAGGKQTAINKQFFEKWHSKLKSCICPTIYVCKPGYPACQNTICEYKQVSANE